MTKIAFDPAAYQSERHANSPMNLARRLEWRLQWEKAQLDNWQTYRQADMQQLDNNGPPVDAGEGSLKTMHEAFAQRPLASDQLPVVTETRRSDRLDTHQLKLTYDQSNPKEARSPTVYTGVAPPGGEGRGRTLFISPNTSQTGRAAPIPLSRQSQSSGVHIYQADGGVEVALRNTGLNGKDGVTLMMGLKRDLASLGLKLTRLILNGELLWQTTTTTPKDLAFIDMDEAPIDKIY
ncbi:MAG: hypothetical protein KZQ81_08225 [Candidatus Thiodiazotropha sp. (ex Rostrolucina anterorostrata)]|nr:hypothetical protein [Candidatus Thiodiazotropha sp. (ex Rostrolucina anterorostrata)]